MHSITSQSQLYDISSDWDPELESHIEGNLATEVSMIVLDTLTVVEQVLSSEQPLKYKSWVSSSSH